MTRPAIAVADEQLRQTWAELPDAAISFEVARSNPALVICLRNLAEIRQRRQAARAPSSAQRIDCKRAAANDRDD